MVYVPVHDEHPFQTLFLQSVGRGYRYVVEKAEAHPSAAAGVVAGRPHQHEGLLAGLERPIHRQEPGAGGQDRRLVRRRRHGGIEVEPAATVVRQLAHRLDVAGVVHAGDRRDGGRLRCDPLQIETARRGAPRGPPRASACSPDAHRSRARGRADDRRRRCAARRSGYYSIRRAQL